MTEEVLQILLVEDNSKDVKLTVHALKEENLGNSIQVARDGEEALDVLFCRGEFASRSFDNPPRLVLLDLKLPKSMTWWKVISWVSTPISRSPWTLMPSGMR
jgi:CheY-like chemotaxis protein